MGFVSVMSSNAPKKTIVGIKMSANVNATKRMIVYLKSGTQLCRPWSGTKAYANACVNQVLAMRATPGMWKRADVSARFKSVQKLTNHLTSKHASARASPESVLNLSVSIMIFAIAFANPKTASLIIS